MRKIKLEINERRTTMTYRTDKNKIRYNMNRVQIVLTTENRIS